MIGVGLEKGSSLSHEGIFSLIFQRTEGGRGRKGRKGELREEGRERTDTSIGCLPHTP